MSARICVGGIHAKSVEFAKVSAGRSDG